MQTSRLLSALSLLVAACSSGEGGGIQPEPQAATSAGTGAGGATATGTGGATATGTGGATTTGTGGGPDVNDATAELVMETLPGRWGNVAQVEETPSIPAKDLRVCRLAAPELGDRVLYVERSEPAAPDLPDVQLILDVEANSPNYNQAVARVFVPEEPGVWVGLCEGATSPPTPPSELRGLGEACDRSFFYNDSTFFIKMSVSGGIDCVPGAPSGTVQAISEMTFNQDTLSSVDSFSLEGGEIERDPPGEDLYMFTRNAEAR